MDELLDTNLKYCPQCGAMTDTDARFCKYCAYDLAGSDINQNILAEIKQSPIKSNTLIIAGGIGLLVVGLIGAVIFFNTGKTNQSIAENTNSFSQTSASTLTLGEKAQQIEQKILRGEALSASDLEGIPGPELRILRNVNFARYGRKYNRPGLGDYFFSRPWYKPNDSFNDKMLTSTDKANVALILSLEQPSNSETNTTTAVANNSTPAISESPTSSGTSYSPLDSGKLTQSKAQNVLSKWMERRGSVEVKGIQEIPQQNAAKADITFTNFKFNERYLVGGGVKEHDYTGPGFALFTHYNDGRWVLTEVSINSFWWDNLGIEAN